MSSAQFVDFCIHHLNDMVTPLAGHIVHARYEVVQVQTAGKADTIVVAVTDAATGNSRWQPCR